MRPVIWDVTPYIRMLLLLPASCLFLVRLIFYPEDEDDILLLNMSLLNGLHFFISHSIDFVLTAVMRT
jgi:hypothetical protein